MKPACGCWEGDERQGGEATRVENEQSDSTGSPGGAAASGTFLEEVAAEPRQEARVGPSSPGSSVLWGGWVTRGPATRSSRDKVAMQVLPCCSDISGEMVASAEKTTQLLFRGAQACMDPAWEEACAIVHTPESPKPGPTEAPRAARGQMLIGPDGRLTRSRAQASEADPAMAASGACSSCVRAVDGKAACGQCERALCGRCVRTCCGCGAVACTLCALVDCSDLHEKVLCTSCAMFEA